MKILGIIFFFFLTLITIAAVGFGSPWIEAWIRNTVFVKKIESSADLPWVDAGKQARYYAQREADWNRGIVTLKAWGSGRWNKEVPIDTAFKAFSFLEKNRAMEDWPEVTTFSTYNVYDQLLPTDKVSQDSYGNTTVEYKVRVAPYDFYLVSIEPTVILMKSHPELPAWWQDYVGSENDMQNDWTRYYKSIPEDQLIGDPVWLKNPLQFGTHLPQGTEWLWFSPELNQLPKAISLDQAGQAFIPLQKGKLTFTPSSSGWKVKRE